MACAVTKVEYVFFFNDAATSEIYTLSLHDALPISAASSSVARSLGPGGASTQSAMCSGSHVGSPPTRGRPMPMRTRADRKSTRLNSSHANISYAVFCLKKKKEFY